MDFADWLQQQLDERGWNQADLVDTARARGYKITAAQISRILSREQDAGVSACISIAHGLQIPREEVFRQRGWLLLESEDIKEKARIDHRLARLVEETALLPPHLRDALLNGALGILEALKEVAETDQKSSAPDEVSVERVKDSVQAEGGMPAEEQWITVEEAAEQSGYAVRTIQRLLQQELISGWKPGNEWLTTLEAVMQYKQQAKRGRPKNDKLD